MHAQEIAAIIVGGQDDFISGTDLQRSQGQLHGKSAAAARGREFKIVILCQLFL